MPRNISFSMTEPQFLDGSKTVTRRMGWKALKPGDRLRAVRKAMGLKKGEKVHVLGEIVVTDVRREHLSTITADDCAREGFPNMTPQEFIAFFCKGHTGCTPASIVTRIEFKRVEKQLCLPPDDCDGDDDTCPNCGGEGLVWGCFEDCCSCTDDDGLGCAPSRCDWCRPLRSKASA